MAQSDDPQTRDVANDLRRTDPDDIERIEVSQPVDKSGNPTDMKVSKYGDSVPGPGSTGQ
jgi:hypothetical protein